MFKERAKGLNLHVPKGTLQGDWQKQCLLLYFIFSIPMSMNLVITETIGALALLPTVCRWPPAGPPVESDPGHLAVKFPGVTPSLFACLLRSRLVCANPHNES